MHPPKRVLIESLPGGRHAVSFDYDEQITALLKIAVPSYARYWDRDDHIWIVDIVYPLRCFIEALRYRGHDVVGDVPDMPSCRECGASISQHNLVGLCRECRLVATNERMTGRTEPGEPVPLSEAIALVAERLGIEQHRREL